MKAIVLSAGQGRRLLPLTATRPKCLIEVRGRSVLEWQLRTLAEAGITAVTVVVGFAAEAVERCLLEHCPSGMEARALFNPLYDRADNLVSCIAARGEMSEDFLLVNGDTLFEPVVVRRLRASRSDPVVVAVGTKAVYDADDMKVICHNGRVTRIGKDLPVGEVGGEAIGVSLFRGAGPRLFGEALDEVAAEPDAHRRWYLSAVDRLAARGLVHAELVDDAGWAEIDYPHDLERASALASAWDLPGTPAAVAADTVTT